MSASETQLSDSNRYTVYDQHGNRLDVVNTDDCRAIERRLNACVDELERAARVMPQNYTITITRIAKAIANAKKPL